MGFGTYQHFHSADFSIKFNIFVNNSQVLTVENYDITSSQIKDKIAPVKFKSPINLTAGASITIQMMHKEV